MFKAHFSLTAIITFKVDCCCHCSVLS